MTTTQKGDVMGKRRQCQGKLPEGDLSLESNEDEMELTRDGGEGGSSICTRFQTTCNIRS